MSYLMTSPTLAQRLAVWRATRLLGWLVTWTYQLINHKPSQRRGRHQPIGFVWGVVWRASWKTCRRACRVVHA